MDKIREELDIYGYALLGKMLTDRQVEFFRDDLLKQQIDHVKKHGEEKLNKYNELEFLRNCGSFHQNYLNLIEANWVNDLINATLNEKAIIHGYHGILTSSKSHDDEKERFSPMRFHRDAPWFKDTRTCVLILMPLVDFTLDVGPTEVAPATHRCKEMPSQELLDRRATPLLAPAGHVFAMDGTLFHRAGKNVSGKMRPMLQMNWTLAFMKQQIDLWKPGMHPFDDCSDLVKARLGYNVRTYDHPDEMFTDDRKWKSGNYSMENTHIDR